MDVQTKKLVTSCVPLHATAEKALKAQGPTVQPKIEGVGFGLSLPQQKPQPSEPRSLR